MAESKESLLQDVDKCLNENAIDTVYYSMVGNEKPERGEIVLAYRFMGKDYCFDNQFARVVQIRTGCGQFGSDMYFLRMPDGSLITAENQSYRKVPAKFMELIESYFETDIDYEDFELGYTKNGENLEVGFIVDGKDTQGTPDTPFSMVVMNDQQNTETKQNTK